MYREIRKKRLILENRKPFERQLALEIKEIELVDMIYTTMRLGGGYIDREEIKTIIDGNVIKEATIMEHTIINNYKILQHELDSLMEMRSSLSLRTIIRLYETIYGICRGYRTTNPILKQYSYNPVHYKDIEQQMNVLMNWIARDNPGETTNELLKATHFHNRFIEIYPFEEGNEEIARIAVWYYMKIKGYPIFTMNMSFEEYNSAIERYIRNEDIKPLYSAFERSLYNKLDYLLNLTSDDI